MAQIATFYLLSIENLESLQNIKDPAFARNKKWLGLHKKTAGLLVKKLDQVAIETVKWQWSGLAFVVLSVFSKEKLEVDWYRLEHGALSASLSEKWATGVYIFSAKDEEMQKLKPNGFYYSMEEIDEFALQLEGTKPANPEIMKNAVELMDVFLSKLTDDRAALLVIN